MFFVLISYLIYLFFSKKLKFHGERRQKLETLKIQYVKTALEGIKEIIFYQKQNFFFNLTKIQLLKTITVHQYYKEFKLYPGSF